MKNSKHNLNKYYELCIEGDHVDHDENGQSLNEYRHILCLECSLPDEGALPQPYRVAARQLLRRTQEGVYGEYLSRHREIFSGSMGMIVVSARIKRILATVLADEIYLAKARLCPDPEKTPETYWAIKPRMFWGDLAFAKTLSICAACGQPQECRVNPACFESMSGEKILFEKEKLPDADYFCSKTWFGNRKNSPFGFLRQVFLSGRFYNLLLKCKIKGLLFPQKYIAFADGIPEADERESSAWLEKNYAVLKKENLAE